MLSLFLIEDTMIRIRTNMVAKPIMIDLPFCIAHSIARWSRCFLYEYSIPSLSVSALISAIRTLSLSIKSFIEPPQYGQESLVKPLSLSRNMVALQRLHVNWIVRIVAPPFFLTVGCFARNFSGLTSLYKKRCCVFATSHVKIL